MQLSARARGFESLTLRHETFSKNHAVSVFLGIAWFFCFVRNSAAHANAVKQPVFMLFCRKMQHEMQHEKRRHREEDFLRVPPLFYFSLSDFSKEIIDAIIYIFPFFAERVLIYILERSVRRPAAALHGILIRNAQGYHDRSIHVP